MSSTSAARRSPAAASSARTWAQRTCSTSRSSALTASTDLGDGGDEGDVHHPRRRRERGQRPRHGRRHPRHPRSRGVRRGLRCDVRWRSARRIQRPGVRVHAGPPAGNRRQHRLSGRSRGSSRGGPRARSFGRTRSWTRFSATISFDENGDSSQKFISFYKTDVTLNDGAGGWVFVKQQDFAAPAE